MIQTFADKGIQQVFIAGKSKRLSLDTPEYVGSHEQHPRLLVT
jgi:hypothetical protein